MTTTSPSRLPYLQLVGMLLLASRAIAAEPPMIRYHVSLPERQAHRVHVSMIVDGPVDAPLDVAMPVWTPGSYLVREFARHVLDLAATDGDGRSLPVEKIDKNTWRVEAGGAATVALDYDLYANELSVRTNHVDTDHAFLSPAGTFLFVRGRQDEPARITVETPEGWDVFTGLPQDGDGWRAADYDTLVDSPLEIGPHRELSYELEGVPHRIVLAGDGDVDADKLLADIRLITAEDKEIFGFLPFDDYTFIVLLVDSGGGGLEHKNSSVNMVSRWSLDKPDKYRGFLSLIAHEYFHAWNVKRFRPEALGPFDYDGENYTPDLWVAEGITSYYDDLVTLRAGFAEKVETYLEARGKAFRSESERPGSRLMSLAQSSHDAWVKLYRADENSTNSSISYYSKGALVALMLDLRIRRLTDGQRDLSDALRLGWERYTGRGVGYPAGGIEALASEVADADLTTFFDDYVRGTRPLEPDVDLTFVGLELAIEPKSSDRKLPEDEQGFPLEPDLGATVRDQGGLARIHTVREGSAAYHAGLNHDDLVLAVDDMRVTAETLQDRLDRTAGQPVTITFYRGQSLRAVELTPDLRRVATWKLAPLDDPSDDQRERFKAWTKWDLPVTPTSED